MLAGGTPRFVPLHSTPGSGSGAISGNEWVLDTRELESAFNSNKNDCAKPTFLPEYVAVTNSICRF